MEMARDQIPESERRKDMHTLTRVTKKKVCIKVHAGGAAENIGHVTARTKATSG